ncbi:hypothetical protein VUR80DRAFT_1344 [Thermomyces stellatus]
MCWAESLQYACACYHGHRVYSPCPRGDARGSCPAIEKQGVARTEGLCPPCRARNRQGEALGLGPGADGLARVVRRAVSLEASPSADNGSVVGVVARISAIASAGTGPGENGEFMAGLEWTTGTGQAKAPGPDRQARRGPSG